ncbi:MULTISPECIES: helix-turn-helix domain-containing protein [unclassified Staphylococcus]|uniref:winged helix-turn-helix transcriptional regulator n=1 Tax=unclassified Staphylococcus TaxID=91994 RepID=UPI0021CE1B0A|nr:MULTISPECIES: helix-turn-helix domain-containing protein [unclassified Staphylococcus]UXR69154.1 helix-turn-helix transcriptional regulator [Staphylococcus sp. IVB6246]UXR71208.1 helix-turn-helix transcriptional regulator [Staphylococcus sp. IVB6240]UXR73481.1 helix-turn-helix transcriptional regulator [Staphylococcus sp. IVB6238]UXR75799.1 helix-turn-helix transcriptional regulator [Staphylococcus sp. IVB6233]UXR79998.1 helix-turn-helix transcriptional regulator [Staphylococcus sp. IVB6218
MEVCPYIEETFKILGRSWNGLILHYLDKCPDQSAHFSDMKRDLKPITNRALSLKLTELAEAQLLVKDVISENPPSVRYQLTEKGKALAEALVPLEDWAHKHMELKQEVQ